MGFSGDIDNVAKAGFTGLIGAICLACPRRLRLIPNPCLVMAGPFPAIHAFD